MTRNDGTLFDPRTTLATELRAVNYRTVLCGKYFNNLSSVLDKTPEGWDDIAIKDEGAYYDYPAWINGLREYHADLVSDYSTDVMARHCLRFVQAVPAGQPLFAYIAPNATHGGWDENGKKDGKLPVAAPRHRGDPRCATAGSWKPASYNEADVSDKPAYIASRPLLGDENGWPLRKACEAMLSVDEWLGAITDALRNQGRYENTVFVLTADNGMGWGAHRWKGKVAPHTAQTPLFVSWPAQLGPSASTNNALLTNPDVAPTLCDIAGCSMGPFANGFGVDGESFAGLLASRYTSLPNRTAILLEGGGTGAVPAYRAILTSSDHDVGRWLFAKYETAEQELYDLSGGPCLGWAVGDPGDPCMMRNRAYKAAYADIKRALRAELASMW